MAQSLHLLNSQEVLARLAAANGRPALLVGDHNRSIEENIRQLYLLAYSRPPTSDEMRIGCAYLQRKSEAGKVREGYEDVVWAMINTKEFLFNH